MKIGANLNKIIDFIEGENKEAEKDFSGIFSVYSDFIKTLITSGDFVENSKEFVRQNGEFDCYSSGKLNDFLFALNQTMMGIMLQDSYLGNEADPDSFYNLYTEFLYQARILA